MKKRILSALLCATVLLSTLPTVWAAGTMEITLDANKTSVTEGDRFTVRVETENNPGFDAIQINVHFDEDVLSCTDIQPGEVLSQDGILYDGNASNDSMATFVAIRVAPIQGDGTLAELTFKAKDDGTSPLWLEIISLESGGKRLSADLDTLKIEVASEADDTAASSPSGDKKPEAKPQAPQPESDPEPETSYVVFTDVSKNHWAYSYIQDAVRNNLFSGVAPGVFAPDMTVTRGMFVQILYSSVGSPEVTPVSFGDVSPDAWYADAVSWASRQGIVSGIGNGNFGPDLPITREQLALILYQYAKGTSPGTELLVRMFYPDGGQISDWALTALSWAINEGLVSGKSGNYLAPQATATRAEVAVIMQNFVNLSK